MIKICFVCLGNICRSPMAEFIMKKKINDLNLENEFYIESRATSHEEMGNDIYPPIQSILKEKNIPYTPHHSTPLKRSDYQNLDYFIGMDSSNVLNMKNLFGSDPEQKINRLLDFANLNKDIEDPWYTGNFDKVYMEISLGCTVLLEAIKKTK